MTKLELLDKLGLIDEDEFCCLCKLWPKTVRAYVRWGDFPIKPVIIGKAWYFHIEDLRNLPPTDFRKV